MNNKHIHIVSFDVPYPADYGGVIDVFYRVKALHKLGVKITLHCFEYGRDEAPELLSYADQVYYYTRRKSIKDGLSSIPFIVKTRDSKTLLENLLKDSNPILFEGLHTTFHITNTQLKERVKIVRTHNIEHDYYSELAKNSNGLKKQYYAREAKKLKTYESVLKSADYILAIKESDKNYFKQYNKNVQLLEASSDSVAKMKEETEPYFLFHGNLSVEENEVGIKWLIKNVFEPENLCQKLIVAGKNPSEKLSQACEEFGAKLVANPDNEKMTELIQKARVHVFYSEQPTGVKLKLINALSSSGHIIVNDKMVAGIKQNVPCTIANNKNEFCSAVKEAIKAEISSEKYQQRVDFLHQNFNTVENCKKILEIL